MASESTREELEKRVKALETQILEAERDQKMVEDARNFHELLRSAPYGIFFIDLAGKIILANEMGAERLGKAAKEIIGTALGDYFPSDVAENRRLRGIEAVKSGKPQRFEDQVGERWYHSAICPVKDESGRVTSLAIYSADITDRKRFEEALRQSEATLQSVFRAAPVGICIMKDRVYQSANPFWCESFGYPEESIIGKNTRMLYESDEEHERVGRILYMHLQEGGLASTETRLRRSDGVFREVVLTAAPLRGDDLSAGTVVAIHDVTERKRAEEARRTSEARFRQMADLLPQAVYETDTHGILTYANRCAFDLFGYTREDFEQGLNVFQMMIPEDRDRAASAIQAVLAGNPPGIDRRYRALRKDGTSFPVAIYSSPILHESSTVGLRGIIVDMTEQERAEEERERLHDQLHHAQKMEAIGTLAGGIAHDFNNLLMGIQGRASLMLADMDSSDPYFEHLKGIEEYVRSAADLTSQLLGFARGGKYEVKVTDLNELADRSATLFGRTKKEITVHRKLQPDLWTVEVDRRQVEQVLLNLFVNAWQAMPAGGEIYLQTSNVVLDEAYVKPHGLNSGEYVKISVTDTGVGMDELTKQRLFDPFFTTKGMGRGTGLGLASAYGIIKNHNGIITVYSEKGRGTTFNIYLRACGKGASGGKEMEGDLVKGEGTILLVDDEEMILEVDKPLLERLGYEVLVARSGKEAVELYQRNMGRIDMVILDMVMPQMSGGETFDQLKAIDPEAMVLLSSGYSINGQAQEILNRGCHGFIQKPFNLRELSQRLREMLGSP